MPISMQLIDIIDYFLPEIVNQLFHNTLEYFRGCRCQKLLTSLASTSEIANQVSYDCQYRCQ
jgi:hypothetical protein